MSKEKTHNLHSKLLQRRVLRHKTTPEENAVWSILKGKRLEGYKWRRQFSVGPYILDFYCPSERLCVEIDGIQHESEEQKKHDTARSEYLAKQGIRVLRVPNGVVWMQSDIIVKAIMEVINNPQ